MAAPYADRPLRDEIVEAVANLELILVVELVQCLARVRVPGTAQTAATTGLAAATTLSEPIEATVRPARTCRVAVTSRQERVS